MGEETRVSFSGFESKLSTVGMACFRILYGKARERVTLEGPVKVYDMPVAEFLQESGAHDMETAAQSIRDIIQCRIEIKKGELLYFIPFFTSVAIEKGVVRYSLPAELENVIASVALPDPA